MRIILNMLLCALPHMPAPLSVISRCCCLSYADIVVAHMSIALNEAIVTKCDKIGAMGQTMVFRACARFVFLFAWSPVASMPDKVPNHETGARCGAV
jgi:hypothetical protein